MEGPPLSSFKYKPFCNIDEHFFMIEASSILFETSSPFSLNNILFEFNPLLLKYGLIVFQRLLLFDKYFTFRFGK